MPLLCPQEPGIRDYLPIGGDGQAGKPDIYADLTITGRERRGLSFHHERGIVATVRLPDERDRGRLGRQVPGPFDLDIPDLGYVQTWPVQGEPVPSEPNRLPPALRAELRMPDPVALPFTGQ